MYINLSLATQIPEMPVCPDLLFMKLLNSYCGLNKCYPKFPHVLVI